MLYEQPGVEIEHETNGYYCGGNCNEDRVWKVSKMNPNIHFSAGQTGLEFAKNKKKLFQHLESTCPHEYIYTHIAVFVGACSFLDKQLDELREKKGYYTSFEMFFKEFQERLYPDLQNIRKSQERPQGVDIKFCSAKGRAGMGMAKESLIKGRFLGHMG